MARLIHGPDPTRLDALALGQDAGTDALYGCFRLHNPRGEPFAETRDVELVARSGRTVRVTVPPALRVDLPADRKVVNTDLFQLAPIGRHADTMHLLTMRAGWNQTARDIRRLIALDRRGSFVATLAAPGGPIPVATASVLPIGRRHTWIGMILVHPEVRRQGIANAMMQACVRYALEQGRILNGLDATPMGNTVYGAVGYVDAYRIWRSVFELAEFADAPWDRGRIRRLEAADLEAVIRYDAARFLERGAILKRLWADSEGRAFVALDDAGNLAGYCLTRPGRLRPFVGPFTADGEPLARGLLAAAAQALRAETGAETAFLDTPERHFADPGRYEPRVFDQPAKPSGHRLSASLKPVRDFTRMYQLVHDRDVAPLVARFCQAERLAPDALRVADFAATLQRAVANYTQTRAFLDLERDALQAAYWGITGPEKG